MPYSIAVNGACGRMGKAIIRKLSEDNELSLVCAFDVKNFGKDAGELAGVGKLGVSIASSEKVEEEISKQKPDVVIDFTNPEASLSLVKRIAKLGVNFVIGTTGFSETMLKEIESEIVKNKASAVISPNMSIGVNIFFKIMENAARMLKEHEVEIVEIHHDKKKDAPSGTALKIAEIIARQRGRELGDIVKFGREKGVYGKRKREEIFVHAIRGGDVAGEHHAIFFGDAERIEIVHKASSRDIFAIGALKAAKFIADKKRESKIYSMHDVLGI